jgi:low temperature requirement protein LtrA
LPSAWTAASFAHEIAEAHFLAPAAWVLASPFSVIWAWISFSWFASAYDTDDWIFRVVTMVQMLGVLILAMGIKPMFLSLVEGDHVDHRAKVTGYVIMRLALVSQWLQAARQDPQRRQTCLNYAKYLVAAQTRGGAGWTLRRPTRTWKWPPPRSMPASTSGRRNRLGWTANPGLACSKPPTP